MTRRWFRGSEVVGPKWFSQRPSLLPCHYSDWCILSCWYTARRCVCTRGEIFRQTIRSLADMMSKTLVEKKDDSRAEETMSTWELLQQPGVSKALFTFGYTMMLALANTAGEQKHCWTRDVIASLTMNHSIARVLVYQYRYRRPWILSTEDFLLSRCSGCKSRSLDADHFPWTQSESWQPQHHAPLFKRLAVSVRMLSGAE